MAAPQNTLKMRMARGDVVSGIWLATGEPYLAEIAATAGFDWLLIDGEHAPNDLRSMSAQLAVVRSSGSEPVVRLVSDDPNRIKMALDIGVQTLVIPMVNSAAQAREVVRATRYAPEGIRGSGAALGRATDFGKVTDYIATAHEQIAILAQIETRAAVNALDEILAVDGIDGVFVGPSDLSVDMGYQGSYEPQEFQKTVFDVISRARSIGKTAGIIAPEGSFLDGCRQAGLNFIALGADVMILSQALRDLAAGGKSKGGYLAARY